MRITLRTASYNDYEFLFRLRALALGPYVAQIWGWDDDDQRQRFTATFEPSHYQIICDEEDRSEDIGAIEVERRVNEIYLANIELLPAHQGKGIETTIVRSVIAEAEATNVPVALQVFKINPALHLYERLGFVVFCETATHYQLRRPASGQRLPEG